ncbi:MAG TPA: HD family phosphohydrolase [Clostridiaceae bacterium]|jgi:putative nucleotidyltransferase with HDIG domain|nr:HD family phosphohydrolase [Clostridiaceae bacterium]HBF78193.1 HD family phosphohydrolase [Clostridiaceae bacterium]HBG37750.1 HD family phosphohydrolase [Clostridiaceae bacterium]HBN29294.1 HD family phosphohydrolase [Clostridiaceae bacterium]HBX48073.1 HD family phosphohydrolase [Clostridiaceae bacterium]
MRLIGIRRAKSGDILGQSIFGKDGCLILKEGVALTEKYISRLENMGVNTLYIMDPNLDDIKPQDPQFVAIKSDAVKSLSKVFSRLDYNDKAKVNSTLAAVREMVEYLIDNKEINFSYLLELKTYDNYTYVHSLNTCVLALFYGVQMDYSRNMLIDLGTGALLHDIGKMKIPIEVLNKKGRLTDYEFKVIKQHPIDGYNMLRDVGEINEISKDVVLEHHEKVDGTGYPYGLKGDKISKYAKIACISDVYDAIVSDRVYRKGFAANEAYEFILGGCETYFDTDLVQVFKDNFSLYPLGACVKLSNGLEGFVVEHTKGFPDRPKVRILYDENGTVMKPYEIELINHVDIGIEKIIL